MAAVTPNMPAHQSLGALDSRFVPVNDLPWQKSRFAGIETKVLLVDPETGLLTALMRMAPGAMLPDHEHVLIEQTYVLEGSLVDTDGECRAGDFVWRPAGSRHDAWSPNGCVTLAMFQIPNRFYDTPGVIADMSGEDWNSRWGFALPK